MSMRNRKRGPAKVGKEQGVPASGGPKSAAENKPNSQFAVEIGADAQAQFDELPLPIQRRAREVFARLEHWPAVSGVKPLKGAYAGSFRIRTGDYRIVFRLLTAAKLEVWKTGNRKDVYLDRKLPWPHSPHRRCQRSLSQGSSTSQSPRPNTED